MNLLDAIKGLVEKVNESPEKAVALIRYLTYFGYVAKNDDISVAEILNAVKTFQQTFGINETGIGPKTLRAMEWPRCAVPDRLETEAASIRKWGLTKLGYFIKRRDDDLPAAVWDASIGRAFTSWSEVTPLDFYPVDRESDANFILDVGVGRADGFDGPSGTLAWNELVPAPNYKGKVHGKFDISESWVADGSKRGIILEHVACHEIGHGLGVNHSSRNTALMAPFYSANIGKPQPIDDIPRIQAMYGKRNTTIPTPQPEPEPTPNNKIIIELSGKLTGVSIPGYRVIKIDE